MESVLLQAFDPSALGLDAGRIALIMSITTYIRREVIEKFLSGRALGLADRFAPALPVLVSLGLSLLFGQPFWLALKDGVLYGAVAGHLYRTAKVTVKGE